MSFEKLLVITVIAGMIVGPRRLPIYAAQLAGFVRDLRAFVDTTRARAEDEMGLPAGASEWMDLRRYHPRRIVSDALGDGTPVPASADAEGARHSAPDARSKPSADA